MTDVYDQVRKIFITPSFDETDDKTDDETDEQPDTTNMPELESEESAEQQGQGKKNINSKTIN